MRSMKSSRACSKESGYVLLAVMLTLTLMLILLSVEAPRIAQQIKREKEEELVHRGKDYATAVKRFVHKNGGRYPTFSRATGEHQPHPFPAQEIC